MALPGARPAHPAPPGPLRRSALQLALLSSSALSLSVGYRQAQLRLPRQRSTPVSFWYPAKPGAVDHRPYRHFISVAKIVETLQGTQLPGGAKAIIPIAIINEYSHRHPPY